MRLIACLFAAAFAACPIVAQQQMKRPMTFADLMAMKRVSDPQISPSGRWVLFSVTDVSLEKNTKVNHLWVVPLDGSAKEKQLMFGDGESNGRFAPDGKHIALTMKDQIYEMPWDDAAGTVGAPVQVTHVNGGADGAIWSPDSRRLLFVVSVYPECSDEGEWAKEDACDAAKQKAADDSPVKAQIWTHLLYRHWDHYLGDRRSHIAVVDADGGELRDLTPRSAVGDAETPTFSLGGPLGYAWAPDSHEIAYETNLEVGFAKPGVWPQPGESTNNDVFTLKLDEPGAKAVKVSTAMGSDDGPQYSPDGKWLAWRSQARDGYESDKFDLVVMDRSTETIQDLTADFANWIDEFAWSNNSERLYFIAPDHGEEILYSDNFTGDDRHRFGKVPGGWGDMVEVPGNAKAHPGEWVATYVRVDRPTEIVVVDPYKMDDSARILGPGRATGTGVFTHSLVLDTSVPRLTFLTHVNDELVSRLSMSPLEPFWFPGAGGTRVEGFIVKPPNFDPAKKYPVKFLMHGGPQTAWGDSWSYRWNWELFAANGYVLVGINRRGSTGYGQRFVEEVSGDWGGRAYVDLMKGLDYAEKHYSFIDKNRECALGASYGGYMADWVLTHTNRFKCIVTHDGMSDAAAAFGDTEELWFNEWEFRPLAGNGPNAVVEQTKPAYPWDFYGKPEMDDPFIKWSPMRYIKDAHTPTLIIHSQRDYRLDVSQGIELFTALQLRGVPSKMLYFPDEGHWVLKPQNSQLWYETVNDWCDRWLGMNRYATLGPERNPRATPRRPAKQ